MKDVTNYPGDSASPPQAGEGLGSAPAHPAALAGAPAATMNRAGANGQLTMPTPQIPIDEDVDIGGGPVCASGEGTHAAAAAGGRG